MWRLGTIKDLVCFKIPKALGVVSRAKNAAHGNEVVSRKIVGKKNKSARDDIERLSEYLVINEF